LLLTVIRRNSDFSIARIAHFGAVFLSDIAKIPRFVSSMSHFRAIRFCEVNFSCCAKCRPGVTVYKPNCADEIRTHKTRGSSEKRTNRSTPQLKREKPPGVILGRSFLISCSGFCFDPGAICSLFRHRNTQALKVSALIRARSAQRCRVPDRLRSVCRRSERVQHGCVVGGVVTP